ncbi:LLM class flavin-dependent oxidoreductase [Sphingobacterium sp. lm-10]|uniref:LLM class flavin-dependent oxidoreductase n=1 Tax=Sphingobacterium sp. lm-10 TaxID=2944904 RepID=UPI0020203C7D|nr:LLM class flavin-dependent oxidoreductase [Sphingobacterium sp. lm-10]MCL7987162.1 LLM class flavin-dependent oxidoreductase [Sphingobacterium sp. lm-10]
MTNVKFSTLELATVVKGDNLAGAMARTVQSAQASEKYGFERIWLAEHHNMEYIASSATSLLIQHIASNTERIRVGSGGIMLPNHAPLVIAEQFGTLETLFPGRVEIGLGRAPGTDQQTAMALRRNNLNTSFYFKDDVQALQQYLSSGNQTAKVRAFPGEGLEIPLWILGSSTDSAYLAAELGLPYAFAAHFAPAMLSQAIEIYRANFKPSEQLEKPYVLICANIVPAETNEEAQLLSTSLFNMFCGIITNRRAPLSPPTSEPIYAGIPEIEQAVQSMISCTFMGDTPTLVRDLQKFIDQHQPDEIMTTNYIFDNQKRLDAFRLTADIFKQINHQ